MSFISAFGGTTRRTKSLVSKPDFFEENPWARNMSTGFSSIRDGNITIDPSIRAIQEQGLSRINNLYNQTSEGGREILGNLRNLRGRFEGNEGAFQQARVNPLAQQVATRRGELTRSIGLRGVAGSSFGQQDITNFDIDTGRALGDARALATQESLGALQGIDAQTAQTLFNQIGQQAQLNGESLQIAKDRLAQELAALGLGQQQIQTMVQAFESQQNRAFQERKAIADSILGSFKMGK